MYDAGYGSSSRLYESAGSRLGMTPATYRKRGAGLEVKWDIGQTKLGRMLVASTARGICALYFGESDSALEMALLEEYPAARLQRGQQEWMEPLAAAIDASRPAPAIPLDVQATAFQARVWEELRRIPFGETATYSDIAQRIGKPDAVRAVASACARNPVSLLTPCHRVLRKEGSLGGYRWGLDRKRRLLAMEAK
jgi:AraC family transcriptional regulator of adaptative response/methylated-DNA-[protein]-cysteine methyltransferase